MNASAKTTRHHYHRVLSPHSPTQTKIVGRVYQEPTIEMELYKQKLIENPQLYLAILSSSKNSPIPEGCRLGAVTFIQRFGKALNAHFHFHSCIIDGVFDKEGKFYPVNALSPDEIQSVPEQIRKRVLRFFQRKGFLDPDAASDMLD